MQKCGYYPGIPGFFAGMYVQRETIQLWGRASGRTFRRSCFSAVVEVVEVVEWRVTLGRTALMPSPDAAARHTGAGVARRQAHHERMRDERAREAAAGDAELPPEDDAVEMASAAHVLDSVADVGPIKPLPMKSPHTCMHTCAADSAQPLGVATCRPARHGREHVCGVVSEAPLMRHAWAKWNQSLLTLEECRGGR